VTRDARDRAENCLHKHRVFQALYLHFCFRLPPTHARDRPPLPAHIQALARLSRTRSLSISIPLYLSLLFSFLCRNQRRPQE